MVRASLSRKAMLLEANTVSNPDLKGAQYAGQEKQALCQEIPDISTLRETVIALGRENRPTRRLRALSYIRMNTRKCFR